MGCSGRKSQRTALLLHSQAIVREGIRSLLQATDVRVFASCSSSKEAIRSLENSALDLLLVELSGPGLLVARSARELLPASPVLTLATDDTPVNLLIAAIELGIRAHVSLDDPDDIRRALEAVERGESYLTPTLGLSLIRELASAGQNSPLTEREQEILAALPSGKPLAQVAESLCLSTSTVKSHLNRIYRKIGVNTRFAASRYASDVGLSPASLVRKRSAAHF